MAAQLAQLNPAQLSKTPSIPPPPGEAVNLDGDNPLETIIITVTSVFMGLAFFFVAIRLYIKIMRYSRRSWDDVTCVIGLLGTLAFWIVLLLQTVHEDFGKHLWNVPLIITLSDAFLKLAFLSDWICNVAYIFVKLTFFIIYWNIFKPFRWLRFGIIGGAVVVVVVYTAFIIASLVGATPPPGSTWLEFYGKTHNGIGEKLSIPLAALALASDIYILVLPISGVSQLQLSRRRKLGLSMLFMAGTGAILCSSLSLYYRTLLRDADVTYTVVNIQVLVIVELCVGICITCMPATSVFLQHTLPQVSRLLSQPISYLSKLRNTMPPSQSHVPLSNSSNSNNKSKNSSKGGNGMDGPYHNITDWELANGSKESYQMELVSTHAVKTHVAATPFEGHDDDDRIHLRVDLEQG